MSFEIRVSKAGVNSLTETDPNKYIFHSQYNTLKIIATGIISVNIASNFSVTEVSINHGLSYTPAVYAFTKVDGHEYVSTPNSKMSLSIPYFEFTDMATDGSKIYFYFLNQSGNQYGIKIKYYLFEIPL
jgi:hypothetical protein